MFLNKIFSFFIHQTREYNRRKRGNIPREKEDKCFVFQNKEFLLRVGVNFADAQHASNRKNLMSNHPNMSKLELVAKKKDPYHCSDKESVFAPTRDFFLPMRLFFKSYLQSTSSQERLNHLASISAHSDIILNLNLDILTDDVINTESTSQGGKNGPFIRKRLKKSQSGNS